MAGPVVAKQGEVVEKERVGHRGEQRTWTQPKKTAGVAAATTQRVEHKVGGISSQFKKGGGVVALEILKDESEKENVGSRGGIVGQARKAGGGLGLRVVQDVRKVKSGVLADNPTLGNRGGLGALELLKERMKELQLAASLSRLPSRTTGASSSGSSSSSGLVRTPSSREEDSVKFRSSLLPASPFSAEREKSSAQNKSFVPGRTIRRVSTPGLDGTPASENDFGKFRSSLLPASPLSAERENASTQNKPFVPSRITKRLKHIARPLSGPAVRVLVRAEEDNSGSVTKDEVEETPSSVSSPSPVTPPIVSNCSLSSEDVEKYERQLEYDYMGCDRRKRKAEQDPSNRDTTQMEELSASSDKNRLGKPNEGANRAQRHSLGDPYWKEFLQRASRRPAISTVSADKGGEPDRLYIRATKVSGAVREVESEPPKNVRCRYAPISSKSSDTSSLPTKIRPGAVQSASRQSSSAYLDQRGEAGASVALKDSGHRTIGGPSPATAVTSVELASDRVSRLASNVKEVASVELASGVAKRALKVPISSSRGHAHHPPLVESRVESDESTRRNALQTIGSSDVKEERDVAVDMSHDALSSGENNENRSTAAVNDLSSSLGALSIGEKDMIKTAASKPPLQDCMNTSPVPSVVPTNQSTTAKCLEHSGPPITSSHSIVTSENVFNDNAAKGRSASEQTEAQRPRKEAYVEEQGRISPYPAENSRVRPPNLSPVGTSPGECKPGADEKAGPPERAEIKASADNATHSSGGTSKDTSKEPTPATSQKISENSHFVWVEEKRYQKLGKIGKGGSSEVYKVIDSECNIYALKKINLRGRDQCSARGFYQEIEYLKRLRGKRNIVQLIGYEITNRTVIMEDYEGEKISEDAWIFMVLEFGEIDLASILSKKRKEMQESNEIIDDNWLRFYWKHMLLGVRTIHDERIVHADLKPANFLLVRGELKLIDFGIAKAIQNDTTHIVRDSQVGTLNYMSPEAFMMNSRDEEGQMVKCGRSSDIWSLGCILYQMVYGHTPFSHVQSFYAKIQAITSKNYKIEFPPIPDFWLLDVMKKCLTWDRNSRPHITDLLEHPFLRPELAMQHKLPSEPQPPV